MHALGGQRLPVGAAAPISGVSRPFALPRRSSPNQLRSLAAFSFGSPDLFPAVPDATRAPRLIRSVKCRGPLCNIDHPLALTHCGLTDAANRLRLIPQSADLMRTIKRSEQLEHALLQNRRVLCAVDSVCVHAAARWCDQCDAGLCEPDGAAIHAAAL